MQDVAVTALAECMLQCHDGVGRCVGVDTELVGADVPRSQVAQLSDDASKQGRVFLTRDHKLAELRGLSAVYLLPSDDAKQQFQDLQQRFGIR